MFSSLFARDASLLVIYKYSGSIKVSLVVVGPEVGTFLGCSSCISAVHAKPVVCDGIRVMLPVCIYCHDYPWT